MAKNKNKKIAEAIDGYVFAAKGASFDENEVITAFSDEKPILEYDPIFLTDKIIEFGLVLTGIPLYEYQREAIWRIIYSVVSFEGETITALWCRQSGKSESLAFIVDTLCVILPTLAKVFPSLQQYKDGIRIGLFAPQSDQVTTTYNRALSRLRSDNAEIILADPEIDTGLAYGNRLSLTNGSFMMGQTASKTSKIESKTYDLIFIEEAQDMDDFLIEKSIEPMATSTNGTIVKVGTTGTRKCDFFSEIQRNLRRSKGANSGRLRFHFQYDYKEVIRQKRKQFEIDKNPFHLNYERYIAKQIDKRGVGADSFKLSYALIWDLETGMFISDKDWNKCLNKKKGIVRVVEDHWHVVAGLDIAKESASTILTIAKVYPVEEFKPTAKEVLRWIELSGVDYEIQHSLIMEYLIDYNVATLYADNTGVGKPVVDRLMYACGNYVNIVPYTFTRGSKSDMWIALKADIDAGRLIIPANNAARETEEYKNCETQLKGMIKFYDGAYLVAQKGSDDTFDDYGDSMALMVMAGNEEIPESPEIEDLSNPFFSNSGLSQTMAQNSW